MTPHVERTAELGLFASRTLPGFSITEFRQPAHRRLPWHEHAHASVCFVVAGSYAEHARGRQHDCPPRTMVFKPAAERHADVFGALGARCVLTEILPGRLEGCEPFALLNAKPVVARSAKLAALGRSMCDELAQPDAAAVLALEGLILEVLAHVTRSIHDETGAREPQWLRCARELLHDHVGEPLTLSSVARAVGIHPSHLARAFRKRHGRTLGDYLRTLRLERAARELTETEVSIAEIGLRCGFFDQSHFTRAFRRHTGLTPARFRALSS